MTLVHGNVELAKLKAVVTAVEKICVLAQAKLVDCDNHIRDDIIYRHERSPSIFENAGDDIGCIFCDQRFGGYVSVVAFSALERSIPIFGNGLATWP